MKLQHVHHGRFFWNLRHGWFLWIGGFLLGSIFAGSCALLSMMLTH